MELRDLDGKVEDAFQRYMQTDGRCGVSDHPVRRVHPSFTKAITYLTQRNCLPSDIFPALVKAGGGCASKKKVRSLLSGADGAVGSRSRSILMISAKRTEFH